MNEFQIKTARLTLRPMRPDDLDVLSEIFADAEMMRFYDSPFTRQQTQEWIDWSIGGHNKRGHALWAVELDGKVIGDCGITLQKVDEEMFPEIGYHIRRDLWRRGLASKAASACRDWGFANLDTPKLISIVRVGNEASAGVAQKVGMKFWKQTERGNKIHDVFAIERPSH